MRGATDIPNLAWSCLVRSRNLSDPEQWPDKMARRTEVGVKFFLRSML